MLPELYNAHHSLHQDDLSFWMKIAEQAKPPLLELGCGTGRVLIPLARKGYQIIGMDHDSGMLSVLSKALPEALRSRAQIFQASFTAFRLAMKFGAILLTCNTYSTLDYKDRQAVLERALEHLQPDGVFAVSMPNPLLLKRLPRYGAPEVEDIFPHPLDGEPVQVSSEWERQHESFTVYWHYDHLLSNGVTERSTAQARHYLLAPQRHQNEFKAAGFNRLSLIGDYDGSAFTPASSQLIILASK